MTKNINEQKTKVDSESVNELTNQSAAQVNNPNQSCGNLPPLATYEELVEEQAKAIAATIENPFKPDQRINLEETREELATDLVTSETEVPEEKPIVEVDGYGIFTKKNIHLVKAKPKAGKTTMLKIIIAAILRGVLFRLTSSLKNSMIVWFDTEQSMGDTHRIITDIIKLSNKSPDEVNEHVKVYHLRRYFYDELCVKLITALATYKPDVIILDGVVDFVTSFNDEKESRLFVRTLMKLSEEYECSIISVLHTNKPHIDHNPRGHLGTCEVAASETVLECTKDGDIFTVESTESRHVSMPKWHFMYDSKGNIVNADELSNQISRNEDEKKKAAKQAEEAKHVTNIQHIINMNGGKIKRSELKDKLVDLYKIGKTKAYEIINKQIGKTLFDDGNMLRISQQTDIQFETTLDS